MANTQSPDPFSPDLGDWRVNKTGWAIAIDGINLDEPRAYHQSSVYSPPGGGTSMAFTTPNAAALHLNGAWKAAKRARLIKDQMNIDVHSMGQAINLSIPDSELENLYDYFEEMMVVAMSCGNSIEAFCNQVIIEAAKGPIVTRKSKKCGPMSPEWVEKNEFIDDKLKRVVPDLLGLHTPCNKPAWDAYQKIKNIRDRVTHFKRADQARSYDQSCQPTVLLELWMIDCFALPEDTMTVLRYFQPEDQIARWMLNPAWVRPQEVAKASG